MRNEVEKAKIGANIDGVAEIVECIHGRIENLRLLELFHGKLYFLHKVHHDASKKS